MLTKRIIACLDVRDGQVVKGVQFQELRHAGDPGELARRYNVEGIDEVVILDITATLEKRQAMAKVYDPTGRTKELGDVVRLEISVPGKVISSGVEPSGRGIEAAHESKRAYLLIPVRAALEKGNDLVWSVSW